MLWKLSNCKGLIIRLDISKKCKFHAWKFSTYKNEGAKKFKSFFPTKCRYKTTDVKSLKLIPKKTEIKLLLSLAKPEKWKLTGAILFLIVSSAVTMAVPFSIGKIIDIIYTENHDKSRENLNKVGLILLGVFILGAICNFGRIYLMSTSGHKITQSLRKKAYTAILNQETGMFDKVSTGEIVGRLSGK